MAEQRQKKHHILLCVDGKNITLELYPAALWPQCSSREDEYRVRIDGRWHSPTGKFSFLSMPAVGALVASLLAGGVPLEEETPPPLVRHLLVSVACGECLDGLPCESRQGYVIAEPFRGADGRWYVDVLVGAQAMRALCHDVDPVEDRRNNKLLQQMQENS